MRSIQIIALGVTVLVGAAFSTRAGDATSTNKSATVDTIQGCFAYKPVVTWSQQGGLSVWLFRADGKIMQYAFVSSDAVVLSDASYQLGKQLDVTRYEMTLNTGGDGPKGKGVMSLIVDSTSNERKGFTFSADGKEAQFHGSKASELQSLLNDVKGKIDFRRDTNSVWRVIDTDLPNILGRAKK
jgi:hypothetical protein